MNSVQTANFVDLL